MVSFIIWIGVFIPIYQDWNYIFHCVLAPGINEFCKARLLNHTWPRRLLERTTFLQEVGFHIWGDNDPCTNTVYFSFNRFTSREVFVNFSQSEHGPRWNTKRIYLYLHFSVVYIIKVSINKMCIILSSRKMARERDPKIFEEIYANFKMKEFFK